MSSTPHNPQRTVGLLALALALSLSLPPQSAAAQTKASPPASESPSGETYNGSFTEVELLGGLGWPRGIDGRRWSLQANLRHSFLLHLGDTRLGYAYDRFDAGPSLPDQRHGLWLHTGLHPFFISLLWNNWFSYVLASTHLELGAGALFYPGANGQPYGAAGFGWSVGAGVDLPLGMPDEGAIPWLHLLYRHTADATHWSTPDFPARTNALFVGIGWRLNTTLF